MKGKIKMVGPLVVGLVMGVNIWFWGFAFPREAPRQEGANTLGSKGVFEKMDLKIGPKKLGMIIQGDRVDNPVLLFLSGGPAIPEYLLEYYYPTELKKHFTICHYSYEGFGLSYQSGLDPKSLTTESYLDDVKAVGDYLKGRFGQDKIFLLGHSFGSYLGLKAAQSYPEDYACFIAMSQVADQPGSERLSYDAMVKKYQDQGKANRVKALKEHDIHGSQEALDAYLASPIRDQAMHELAGGTLASMDSVMDGIFWPSLRIQDFSRWERINTWRGKMDYAKAPVINESFSFNGLATHQSLDIPYYLLVGEKDLTCHPQVQKDFFDHIQAPKKEIFLFHESAHSPIFEEKKKALGVMETIKGKHWNR